MFIWFLAELEIKVERLELKVARMEVQVRPGGPSRHGENARLCLYSLNFDMPVYVSSYVKISIV